MRLARARALAGLALAAGTVWYLLPALDLLRPGLEDEGDFVQAAHRVLMGQIPYRDFFWFVPPGGFYVLAGWLAAVGDSFLSARWFMVVVAAVNVLLLYWIGLRVLPVRAAAAAAAVYAVTAVPAWPVASHHWVAVTFLLLTTGCLAGHCEGGRRGWLWGAGLAAGMAAVTLQGEGAACLLLLILYGAARRTVPGPAAGGLLAVGVPLAAYMIAHHAFAPMWDAVVTCAAGPARLFNRQPFHPFPLQTVLGGWRAALSLPPHAWLQQARALADFATWPLVLLVDHTLFFPLVAGFVVAAWRRRERPVLMVLAAAQACVALTVLSRPDEAHIGFARSVFWVLLAWCLTEVRWRKTAMVVAVVAALAVGTQAVLRRADFAAPTGTVDFSRGTVRVAASGWAEALRGLNSVLQERTRPGDPIFVYPIFPMLYYFTGRINPTKYDRLVPFLSTPDQIRAVEDAARGGAFKQVVLMPLDVNVYLAGYPTVDRTKFAAADAEIRAALQNAMPGRCLEVGRRMP